MAQAKKKKPNSSKATDGGRQDITLMTLLANEATSDSRKLLKQYNKEDAKNCADLEVKLAELYFGQEDKKQLEKELSNLHPHKDWILKNQKLDPIIEEEKEIEIEDVVAKKSTPESNEKTEAVCPKCATQGNYMSCDGPTSPSYHTPRISVIEYMGIIGMMATIGLTYYVIIKHK